MKTLRTLLVITIAVVGFTTNSFGQQGSSKLSTVPAAANIITAISLQNTDANGLKFGDVIAGAGTVVVTPAGARSATGNTKLGNTSGAQAAHFTVTGEGTSAFTITKPTADITLTKSAGVTMTVGTWTCDKDGALATQALTAGSATFNIGATLTVGATQEAGTYTGVFEVKVDYN